MSRCKSIERHAIMKSKKVEKFGEYEVEFSGTFQPGRPATGPSYSCAGEPAEPAEVDDLYVGVIIKGTAIDITDKLNEKQVDHFTELLIEDAHEHEAEAVNRKMDESKDEKFWGAVAKAHAKGLFGK
jgi:hypothetical protein